MGEAWEDDLPQSLLGREDTNKKTHAPNSMPKIMENCLTVVKNMPIT